MELSLYIDFSLPGNKTHLMHGTVCLVFIMLTAMRARSR